MADLMSAGPNGPCPYLGELSVTLVGVVSMRGKGHWLGVGGSVRVY